MTEIKTLEEMFQHQCSLSQTLCDFRIASRRFAKECSTIAELGTYHLGSGFALLKGLSENQATARSLHCIDIGYPPENLLQAAKHWAEEAGIEFHFQLANTLDIELSPVDLLHIDTFHAYRYLTTELERFSPIAKKYILMHDTSGAFGQNDQTCGWESETKYPAHISRSKRGLWPAVEDFLKTHPEWELYERNKTGDGYTVLKRRSPIL
jgi:hypothetical protein